MADLTPAVYREVVGKMLNDLRVFLDSSENMIFSAALVDGSGAHVKPVADDFEGIGNVTVGTSEVELPFTGTTREIRIRANTSNTGIIYIGKTGVLSDGTNDYARLEAGDEITMKYNDVTNAIYLVSDTAAQTVNAGALL